MSDDRRILPAESGLRCIGGVLASSDDDAVAALVATLIDADDAIARVAQTVTVTGDERCIDAAVPRQSA